MRFYIGAKISLTDVPVVNDLHKRGVGPEKATGTVVPQSDEAQHDHRRSDRCRSCAAGTEADGLLDVDVRQLRKDNRQQDEPPTHRSPDAVAFANSLERQQRPVPEIEWIGDLAECDHRAKRQQPTIDEGSRTRSDEKRRAKRRAQRAPAWKCLVGIDQPQAHDDERGSDQRQGMSGRTGQSGEARRDEREHPTQQQFPNS